jgi:RimJ/RimL family protein N-acetyltransferase/catechol 2,3-dioxygenase-like lactoylglutathione lyase family enzyme
MNIPTLSTVRLILQPLGQDCAALYEQFYTDPIASKEYGGPLTRAAARARLMQDLGSWYLQGFGVWALFQRDTAQLVGVCGFWQGLDWPIELTWWLLPHARGQGLAQEASRAALSHAYAGFGWQAVQTYMHDDNAPARALALRLGGQIVERKQFPDGMARDIFHLPNPANSASAQHRARLPFSVQRLDHLVLRVQDLARAIAFYEQVLGCHVVRRRDDLGLIHLRAGASMIDLISIDGFLGQKGGAAPGSAARNMDHFCLRIEPFDEAGLLAHLAQHQITPIGPAESNFGAEGDGLSLYIPDPDGNLIELKGPATPFQVAGE